MHWKSNRLDGFKKLFEEGLEPRYAKGEATELFFITTRHFLGFGKKEFILNPVHRLSESEILKLHFTLKRLKKGEPIQYILGETEFYGLTLKVTPDALIPRPETEELVQWVIEDAKQERFGSILDIGTGSGCIAIALKKHLSRTQIHGVDYSGKIIALAKGNADMNHVDVIFRQLDILKEGFEKTGFIPQVIVSNPPYVTEQERGTLSGHVIGWEPEEALFTKHKDELVFYRRILELARQSEKTERIYFEINQYKKDGLEQLLAEFDLKNYLFKKDLSGNERMLRVQVKEGV